MIHKLYDKRINVLNKEVCALVLRDLNWKHSHEGGVVSEAGTDINSDMRKTSIIWMHPKDIVSCVSQAHVVTSNMESGWSYVLSAVGDTQIGRYGNGGHYAEHVDTMVPDSNNQQRKLTAVVLLNDSTEYSGGDLQIRGLDGAWVGGILKDAGDMVIFPSYLLHKVTPVLEGTRYTAVTWATGPAFR